jgi:hypothetical protein
MPGTQNRSDSPRPRRISRRDFLKVAAAGLLAGCHPVQPPTAPPTATSRPTDTPVLKPTPVADVRRPDIIKTYPDGPSRVVHARHAGVWDGETLVPEAIRHMLDGSITALTGLNDADEAWAALFAPDERIAIKVNTIQGSRFWTHVPLVMAVTERLQEVGVPAEGIVVFDRYTIELENYGYPINRDGPGVRCTGTDLRYTAGWTLMDTDIQLSDVLLSCHALINMPIIKQHGMSGISFAMKNHYGTFDRPEGFHEGRIERALAELNNLPPIRDRTRLIIGDALTVSTLSWYTGVTGDSIFMSFDPVAHDAAGLQLYCDVMTSEGRNPEGARNRATLWLRNGAELGVGTDDPDHIDLVEVTLG